MNIRNILKMVQLQPRAETSLFNGNIRFVGFTSLQFHPDPDFKIFIHNLPIPVSPHIHDYYEACLLYTSCLFGYRLLCAGRADVPEEMARDGSHGAVRQWDRPGDRTLH